LICYEYVIWAFYFISAIFDLDSMHSNLYSSFVAVIVLHLALANFIYRAYFHTEPVPGFDKLEKEDWKKSVYSIPFCSHIACIWHAYSLIFKITLSFVFIEFSLYCHPSSHFFLQNCISSMVSYIIPLKIKIYIIVLMYYLICYEYDLRLISFQQFSTWIRSIQICTVHLSLSFYSNSHFFILNCHCSPSCPCQLHSPCVLPYRPCSRFDKLEKEECSFLNCCRAYCLNLACLFINF